MATTSRWRLRAREVIECTLAGLPEDATPKERRKAVDAAYPFGERRMHPYKAWLKEINAAFPGEKLNPLPRVSVAFRASPPPALVVSCDWCRKPNQSGGCLVCGQTRMQLQSLTSSDEFTSLTESAWFNVNGTLILADWIEGRGLPELAAMVRDLAEAMRQEWA